MPPPERLRIVVLTGAGISAESGVPTFRAEDGLWEGHRVEDVATPEGFECDPDTVQRFYDDRRAHLATVVPNPAHLALAALEERHDVLVVTQNVDDLHERAGSRNLVHMHGELLRAWCQACDGRFGWDGDLLARPACPGCGEAALRPDVVWFGEYPYGLDRIDDALRRADLFVSIGTSGAVYPAAGFVRSAHDHGTRTLELNLEPSLGTALFDEARHGPAGAVVPAWVDELS
ncbi:NAD-dependent deacetylase [Nocardioides terrae]|uniref:NAD-dependent protein deacylase n=1 Tax=Nocardioides terrae TaxID=574651 RepID=A0A1I1EY03_9ACTN|nr:NAD-dependent deacylase [Nocardioides terrae]SFB91901.1 NAD-dependent deacetylase [Nocardioides terrae]